MLIHLRLCKAGYANGITEARKLDARAVLQALAYEGFCVDYERAYWELNK